MKNGVDFDAQSVISALNDGVGIKIDELEKGYNSEGSDVVYGELYVDYTTADNKDYVVQKSWGLMDIQSVEGDLDVQNGELIVKSDGVLTLSDGESTIIITVTGYQASVQKVLGNGVEIEALGETELPMGASATYADLSEKAEDIAAEYGLVPETATGGEDTNENTTEKVSVGFSAFDVAVASPEGELSVDGQFAVTVPHEVEIPEGAVVELFHIHEVDGEMTAELVEGATVADGVVSFTTTGFSEYVIRYTVEVSIKENNGTINLDFTGYDVAAAPAEGDLIYDTETCSVRVSAEMLRSMIEGAEEAEINFTTETTEGFSFDFDAANMVEPNDAVNFEEGSLIIIADGSAKLTDGVNTLLVNVNGITALSEAILEAEGVKIEVLEGNVPLGSEASYTAHTKEETNALVEEYLTTAEEGEEQTEIAVYLAADLKIVRNDKDVNAEGQFKVTLEKGNLVPEGMMLEKLYHIHGDVVEELVVEETEEGLVFEVTGFSDIVASYVSFQFNGSGKTFTMRRGESALLSEILEEIELKDYNNKDIRISSVTEMSFDKSELFTLEDVGGGDYRITNIDYDSTGATMTLNLDDDGSFNPDPLQIAVSLVDDSVNHTTKIVCFDKDAQEVGTGTPDAHLEGTKYTNPEVYDNYYVLATFERNGVKYWDVQPVNLKSLRTQEEVEQKTVTFSAFKNASNSDDTNTYKVGSSEAVTTRLFRSSDEIQTSAFTYSYNTETGKWVLGNVNDYALTDLPESGYGYFGGITTDGGLSNEIHMKPDTAKGYKVRIRFAPGSQAVIQADTASGNNGNKHYYIIARIKHSSEPMYTYAYKCIDNLDPKNLSSFSGNGYGIDDDGYPYIDFKLENWRIHGSQTSADPFTGRESGLEVRIVENIMDEEHFNISQAILYGVWQELDGKGDVFFDGDDLANVYSLSYDTYETKGFFYQEPKDSSNIIWCYDQITLKGKTDSADYDYRTILGPNVVYGIVAEHLYQPNHLQTNFAVNHYSGHGHDARPDLSGDNSGNIVIGEFNISDGSKRNSVGEIATDATWGRLKIGSPLNGTLVVYADNDSGYFETDTNGNTVQANVYNNPSQTILVPSNGSDLSANIVEPGIEYMKRMSAILAAKDSTFRPSGTDGERITIDTRSYGDNATIYLNGDNIRGIIGTSGGLTIKKKDNQTIVFNFTDTRNSKRVTINQFNVWQPSFAQYGYSETSPFKTESPEATGTDNNKMMDDIARHIVWNLAACTDKVTIDTAAGVFLQPNDDSETEIKGTSAGWIVSDGYVYNGTAEWHNVFEEMPDAVEVNLFALKYLDGKMPAQNKKYEFKLEQLVFDYNSSDGSISNKRFVEIDSQENEYFTVEFKAVKDTQMHLGWNIFKITETGKSTKNPTDTDSYITDKTEYYAAVYLKVGVITGQRSDRTIYDVSTPRYYTAFDIKAYQPYTIDGENSPNPVLTGVSGPRTTIPVFENETITKGLTLMKRVNGTEETRKKFTFKVELWNETTDGTTTTETPLSVSSIAATGLSSGSSVSLTTEGTRSVAEIQIRNSQKVTLQVPDGAHYKISEVKVGTTDIDGTTHSAEGYTAVPHKRMDGDTVIEEYFVVGKMEGEDAAVSETFVNNYEAKGEFPLDVVKTLMNGATEMSLVDNQFAFTVTGGNKTLYGFNNASGSVVFKYEDEIGNMITTNKLTFDQEAMTGATRNAEGKLSKEVSIVIHEGQGSLDTTAIAAYNTAHPGYDFSYENVKYEDDKEIILVLTDEGNGTISVKQKNAPTATTMSVSFTNTLVKKAQATLEGWKVMEGRAIEKDEFIFNAKLISVDGTDVTEATINAVNVSGEYVNTKEQRDALYAKRKQASPIDVIGTNAAKAANTQAAITFPTIRYSAAGTYVYEITEDTNSMPENARQKAGTPSTYYAKVVVTENSTTHELSSVVTYYKNIPAGEVVTGDGAPAYETTLVSGKTLLEISEKPTFTNEERGVGFSVTKDWLDADSVKATGVKWITFSLKRNGEDVTAADLTGKFSNSNHDESNGNAEIGSVTLEGNYIKLTSDSDGNWPIATFTGMTAGRYAIREVGHSDVTGGLKTTYAVTTPATATEPAKTTTTYIVRDGQSLKITNKETKDSDTSIQVKKVWKVKNTTTNEETVYTPTTGSAEFELYGQKTSGGGSGDKIRYYLNNSGAENIKEVSSANKVKVTYHVVFEKYDDKVSFYSQLSNGIKLADVKLAADFDKGGDGTYYYNNGPQGVVATYSEIQPTSPVYTGGTDDASIKSFLNGNAGPIDVVFEIPIVEGTKIIQVGSVQLKNYNTYDNFTVTTDARKYDPELIASFEVKPSNNWSWNSGTLPLVRDDGSTTWKYFVKEVSNTENISVSFTPAGTTVEGLEQSDKVTGGIITATNTMDEVNKQVIKAWNPSQAPENVTIKLALYAGTTEEAAAASLSPVRLIELDGTENAEDANHNSESPAWTANFLHLPKYDTDGTALVYIVEETQGAVGYEVKYGSDTTGTATYVLVDDSGVTITNTQAQEGSLIIEKKISNGNATGKTFTFNVALTNTTAIDATKINVTGGTKGTVTTDGNTVTIPVTITGAGKVKLSKIPKETTYEVTEPSEHLPAGWSQNGEIVYGDNTKTISVGDQDKVDVTNKYEATGSATFSAEKAANDVLGDKTFTFQLLNANDTVLQTSTAVTQGNTATFTAITYTLDDVANSPITYKIREVIPDDATNGSGVTWAAATPEQKAAGGFKKDGVTYDATVHTVVVTLTDKGDGTLDVKYDGTTEFTTPEFTNSYEAINTVQFKAKKEFTNGALSAEKTFTFKLTQVTGENEKRAATSDDIGTGDGKIPALKLSSYMTQTTTATSGNTDTVIFDAINFTKNGTLDETGEYWFLLEEDVPSGVDANGMLNGIKYDTTKKWIKVTVADAGNGMLTVTKTPALDTDGNDGTWTNEQLGKITVNKEVQLGSAATTSAETFYVALFTRTGMEGSYTYARVANTDIKAVTTTTPAVFEKLPIGTYYVYEVQGASDDTRIESVFGVYTVTGSGTELVMSATDYEKTATITNNKEVLETTIQKAWTLNGEAIATAANSTVTFQLKKKVGSGTWTDVTGANGTVGVTGANLITVDMEEGTQTTTTDTAQKVQWTNLPKLEGGQEVTYRAVETGFTYNGQTYSVTETESEGGYSYTAMPTGTIIQLAAYFEVGSADASGTTTVTNNTTTTGVEAAKVWNSTASAAMAWPADIYSVTFTLKASTNAGETWADANTVVNPLPNSQNVSVEILSTAETKKATWLNLPTKVWDSATSTWKDVTYTVEEIAVNYKAGETKGAAATLTDFNAEKSVDASTAAITITNKPTTTVSATKTWKDAAENDATWPANLRVKVKLTGTSETGDTVKIEKTDSIIDNTVDEDLDGNSGKEATAGTYTWYDLPVYDTAGKAYTWRVEETAIEYTADNGTTWNSVTSGVYNPTYSPEGGAVSNGGTVAITNTPAALELDVTKNWSNFEIPTGYKVRVTYALHQGNTTDSNADSEITEKQQQLIYTSLTSTTATWTGLDRYSVDGQTKYRYWATEKKVELVPTDKADDADAEETENGIIDIFSIFTVTTGDETLGTGEDANKLSQTVTNTVRKIKVTATKAWQKPDGTEWTEELPTSATFTLYKLKEGETVATDGVETVTGTLDGTVDTAEAGQPTLKTGELTAWNYTWDDLDAKYWDATAKQYKSYTFAVKEASVVYKTVTYTIGSQTKFLVTEGILGGNAAEGFTITLTNKLNEKDVEFGKQWKNASGTPQTWVTDGSNDASITIEFTRVRATSSSDSTLYSDSTFTKTFSVKLNDATMTSTDEVEADRATYNLIWTTPDEPSGDPTQTDYIYKFKIAGLEKYYKDGDWETEWHYRIAETATPTIDGKMFNAPSYSVNQTYAGEDEYIINSEYAGFELPSTGGPGTTGFYVLGSILTLLALVLLVTKKRSDGAGIE